MRLTNITVNYKAKTYRIFFKDSWANGLFDYGLGLMGNSSMGSAKWVRPDGLADCGPILGHFCRP